MKKDSRKSLTFNYNYLNLLSVVKENNAVKASYRYLADGTKMSVRNGNGNTGYDYEGSFVYTVTNNTPTLEAAHFTDGQLKATGVNYTLTDHLGSVRAVVDANGTLLEQNDYYPFGSRHVNVSYASSDNRYTFSGKEEQDLLDLNTYDFGARIHGSNLTRWTTADPLCEDYYSLSLQNYCLNNPVRLIDPTGAHPIYGIDGRFLGTDDMGISGPAMIMDEMFFTQGMPYSSVLCHLYDGYLTPEAQLRFDLHFRTLFTRPDYDGFVTAEEGIEWAKSHPGALDNPTPDNMLYIDAAKLDFGYIYSQFENYRGINLFNWKNILMSRFNSKLHHTIYALGRVDMTLNEEDLTVRIVNDYKLPDGERATDYDWNPGGSFLRNLMIKLETTVKNIKPDMGFRVYYYGIGQLKHK